MIHVFGGAGFVGTRLANVLSNLGIEFQIFDKTLAGESHVDITVPDSLDRLAAADVVINLAAEHRDDITPKSLYALVNVEGSKNVCNHCRRHGIKTIVFTSTVAVYGFAPEGTDESGSLRPFNEYGRSKMEAEAVYRRWLAEDPTRRSLIIVRPTVIFGEQNRGNVYTLLRQIKKNRFVMFGSGKNKKSMAYVQNVAEFLAFSIRLGPGEHLYNYVDKPDIDMQTLVRLSRSVLFKRDNLGFRLPAWLGILIGHGFDLLAAIARRPLPISSIRVKKFLATTAFDTSVSATGFRPSCELTAGIRNTLEYEFINGHEKHDSLKTE